MVRGHTLVLGLVVVAAVGVAAGGIPNDGWTLSHTGDEETAIELEPDDPVDGNISDDRIDQYVLDVQRGQRVTVNVTTRAFVGTNGTGIYLIVRGEPIPGPDPGSSSRMQASVNQQDGSTAAASFVATQAGRVRVSFLTYSGFSGGLDRFEYAIEAGIGDAPAEPNDDIENATRVSPPVTLEDQIRVGDTDFFAFDVTAGQRVNLTVDRARQVGMTAVAVYDPDRRAIDTRFVGAPYTEAFEFVAEENGTYAVQIADVEHGSGNYSLGIRIRDWSDDESDNGRDGGSGDGGDDQAPYGGSAAQVPATFDAAHFDVGGAGVAYNDSDEKRRDDSGFRLEVGVDIESPSLGGSGDGSIGYVTAGEWVEYTVRADPGTYTLSLAVAAGREGQLAVSVDGAEIGRLTTRTDGWYEFEERSVGEFTVEEGGTHVIRVEVVGPPLNFDRIVVEAVEDRRATTAGE